jgi:hypothetical protein
VKRPPHAQWARPAGHGFSRLLKSRAKWAGGWTTWLWIKLLFGICGALLVVYGLFARFGRMVLGVMGVLEGCRAVILLREMWTNVVKCVANVDMDLTLSAGAREVKEANATAGPSTSLLTKCREQLRSG